MEEAKCHKSQLTKEDESKEKCRPKKHKGSKRVTKQKRNTQIQPRRWDQTKNEITKPTIAKANPKKYEKKNCQHQKRNQNNTTILKGDLPSQIRRCKSIRKGETGCNGRETNSSLS
jgi:hypothetical protein